MHTGPQRNRELPPEPSLTRALTPAFLRRTALWQRLSAWPAERLGLAVVLSLGAVVLLPFLGSVGLWDPWETHYAEVARSMIVRNDYVHPYWEHAYFFSKPVLSMWMMALGMNLVDALHGPNGAMGLYTEWAVRLPFAFIAMGASVAVFFAGRRIWSQRVGLLAAGVLLTMPVYFLIARQAMTDMPFVGLTSAALACFMVAVFGVRPDAAPRAGWLYAFYALCGFATLAKGLLGIALPGAVILAYTVFSGRWSMLLRYRIPTGALLTLLVAAPWYVTMSLFTGKDDEFKTFAYRFFIHDHFKRLATGVHSTTPDGTFVYYIEQLGFGIFPWVGAVPGALASVHRRLSGRLRTQEQHATLFLFLWISVAWVLFTLAATKFHHYGFPMVVPIAILVAIFLSDLWEQGLDAYRAPVVLGFLLFVAVAQNLVLAPKHLADLYVYNYSRAYPHGEVDPRRLFAAAFSVAAVFLVVAWWRRSRRQVLATLMGLAAAFACYVSWVHWTQLSFHWSQRDLIWTYYQEREADEPLIAYFMNWRGETFYSQNTVIQLKNATKLRQEVAEPGPEYILVEQGRYKGLKNTLGSAKYRFRILDRTNNKFYLVRVEDLEGN